MIRLHNVGKEYPRTGVALNHVSFQMKKGEFVFITGPSGAGKSTVLRLIYMDEKPTHGEVRVSGLTSRTASRHEIAMLRRKLGIVFQDFRLLDDRTAEANVAFALEVTGTPRAAIPPKVNRALAQVGLASKATRYPKELSGGEQQRVTIARALAGDPAIIWADEPTGDLDSEKAQEVVDLLRKLNRERELSLVIVTHDIAVGRQTHRIIRMLDGQIVEELVPEGVQ